MLLVLDRVCGADYVQFVHPGRGLGRDGDHRWGGCGACGCGETFIIFPGAEGKARGYYDPCALGGKTTLAANTGNRTI